MKVIFTSFGYRYEDDPVGGIAIDCRELHNPDKVKGLYFFNGLDDEIKQNLEDAPEYEPLLNDVVELFREKPSDMWFGCTSGKHRSVVIAEAAAKRLRQEYPGITIEVIHRERDKWPTPQ